MSQQKVRSIKQRLKEEKSGEKNITKWLHIMTKISHTYNDEDYQHAEKYEKNQQDTMQCNGTLKEGIATNDSFIRPIQWVPLGVWWENE